MSDLTSINDLAAALLRGVAPPARRKLLGRVAREIRKSQSDRIGQQIQPDGQRFAARKAEPQTKARARKGKIRRKAMFSKLRLAKFLKAGADQGEAWIGFTGRAAAIARIHQDGLDDAPNRGGKKVRYARRVLLGLTDSEQDRILDLLLEEVTQG